MGKTLLHFRTPLSTEQRERLRTGLERHGADVDHDTPSAKPHLCFVRFDERRVSAGMLVAEARRQGLDARLVDV